MISGAVGTSLRRIGILKAIGFTPREVVRAYVAQALIPAGAGSALGVALGNLLAVPLLSDTEAVYGGVSLSVAWWVDVAVPAAALVVVGLAALIPALRAGRLRTVEAVAVGRSPRTRRGPWAHRAMGLLPPPRPVTYGLATPGRVLSRRRARGCRSAGRPAAAWLLAGGRPCAGATYLTEPTYHPAVR
ncbi:FtsX-like permease family protein [Streptomyces sp. NPDC058439]|uniref:FtsX-like permease family protein n=1 Tax=Streptomyces sp. NPDC058439 TaxID=3346500 RepID=UPI0036684A41